MEDQTATPNIKEAIPFLNIKNMDVSLRFYLEGLGFEMTHAWKPEENKIRWCNLRKDNVNLMLQEYLPEFLPAEKPGVGISICFICNDALALYSDFISKGIAVQEPFVGNGMWVVELTDPDGYALCFESSTDVPEGTIHSEWKSK